MSENSEHSPDDTETETKVTENLPDDSSKSEAKLMMNQTGMALLEDEEMPTYISVSSISRREDDSDIVNAKQQENESVEEERSPSPSDDQGASSVYVLSSGEESEQLPYNYEDDEDEYGDSDDMENLEFDHELNSNHPNNIKHLMDEEEDDDSDDEDEEDDEESPRRMHNYDDETEFDYDRASALSDVILSKGLKRRDKEKSYSLQDLTAYKSDAYVNKRKHSSSMRQNYLNIPQNAIVFPAIHKKQLMPGRYQHVQSKVKLYIKDIKDQNRRSIEKHIKNHEDMMHSKSNTEEQHKNSDDVEETKATVTNRMIKDYAEKTIKELEIAEACDEDGVTFTSSIILNGKDKNGLELIQEENAPMQVETQVDVPFESTQEKKDTASSDNKIKQKRNGTMQITFPERESRQFENTMQPTLIQNGHQEAPTILCNLRTLTYEEYMHDTSDSNPKINIDQNAHITEEHIKSEMYNNVEPMDLSDMDNNDTSCHIRIENVKSIETMVDDVKNNKEQVTLNKTKRQNKELDKIESDTLELTALKNQLNQKTVEYNKLYDTYRKQLTENVQMKQELEELKISLAKYKKENKSPEQKIASIQTDFIADSVTNKDRNQAEPTCTKELNNKISGSSVASTLSSIEQWTDSTCNLSLSMKPPVVTKALDSDDSMILIDGTPRKSKNSLSPSFITSSRILQTLSNITQGKKTRPESPLVQNSKKRLNENSAMELDNDNSSSNHPSSSKKRKIGDILGAPQVATESQLKASDTSNAESQPRYTCNLMDEKSQEDSSNIKNQLENATSIESKAESIGEPEDNVKCFVYRENENSKDRSFLILAEEPTKDKISNEKGRIRECGPFLLGNVEVRMSEINGTINIWGKEINEESVTENESEVQTFKVKNDKCHCSPKTLYTRFNGSSMVCSSSKKSKIPAKLELSSVTSNISYPHSASFNTSKPSCSTDKADNMCDQSMFISSCEDCNSSKHHKECLKFKRTCPQDKLHSCYTCNIGHKCSCTLHKEKQKFEDNCSRAKFNPKKHRQNFSKDLELNKRLHENIINSATENNEFTCRHHTTCHYLLHEQEHYPESCSTKETSMCEHITDQECSGTCKHTPSNVDDEEPLIPLKQSSETSETRRRRLSGKRVRGILMDLLRGCGDCYSPNISSRKDCSHKKEIPHLKNCPQIQISPCASPEPSYSNNGQPGGRCCHAYAQRIESQLEEFRVEMEKVRSRSDAILDMLNMLHAVDTN